MAKQIGLTKGKATIVDNAWYHVFRQFQWHYTMPTNQNKQGYAARRVSLGHRQSKIMYMHHFILPPVQGYVIDHRNGNCLDNRYLNLRYCTVVENNYNSPRRREGQSQYKGVSRAKTAGTWRANIYLEGRQKNLGVFDTEKAAAWAYNVEAQKAHGIYAFLNPVSHSDALPRRTAHRKQT